jgi:hypothetical protein
MRSITAAAQNDERNDNDPAAVVVTTENVTQTVVHSQILLENFWGACRFLSLAIILCCAV